MSHAPRRAYVALLVSSTLQIASLCAIGITKCSTVSCAIDETEVADRIGTQALTLQAVATAYAWWSVGVPVHLAVPDVALILALSIVSDDVSRAGHVVISLSLATTRAIIIATSRRSPSICAMYTIVALRSCALVFLLGYACPHVIDQVCDDLATTPLPPAVVMLVELGLSVSGVAYVVVLLCEFPSWESDVFAPLVVAFGGVANVVVAIRSGSPGGGALLAMAAFVDGRLARMLWSVRAPDGRALKKESLPLAVIVVPAALFALW